MATGGERSLACDVVRLSYETNCAAIQICDPPANRMSSRVRRGILDALHRIRSARTAKAVLVHGADLTLSLGADLQEYRQGEGEPGFRELFRAIEDFPIPVVAAAHGLTAGAGVELMMCCHYRCAARGAVFAMPEAALGLVPGAGGTQRLPRLIGAMRAIEMLLTARPVTSGRCLEMGLVDRVVVGSWPRSALEYVADLITEGAEPRRTSRRRIETDGLSDEAVARVLALCAKGSDRVVNHLIVAAVHAAVASSFEEGLDFEHALSKLTLARKLFAQ